MKKMMLFALMLMLVIQTLSMSVWTREIHAAPSGGGSGTSGDPYIILTVQDLSDIRNDLTAYYKLGADIDLSGYDYGDSGGWMPIGDNTNRFTGTLDGNGYEIRNLTINRSSTDYVGLFGFTDTSAQLVDIRLININVTGYTLVGGLVGLSTGTIQNSYATGSVTGTSGVGGLVGLSNGTIQNSYATSSVNGSSNSAGGLVGWNDDTGIIENSYATGSVSGTADRMGGLVGYNLNGGTIRNSYATGSVNGDSAVGGLAGVNQSNSTIQNSYATGSVNGTANVGGLVGINQVNSAIQYSYTTGSVNGTTNVGGLVGYNDSSTIQNSYWNTDIFATDNGFGSGIMTTAMKSAATYAAFDFIDTWGIREGQTYLYLLAFKPMLDVDPLATTMYNLSVSQDTLSVTGVVYDESIGEQVTIHYDIKDISNVTVTSVTYSVYADGSAQAIDRSIPLTGLVDGAYTLHISAVDTYNSAVTATPLAFTVDSTPPSVGFSPNGNAAWATTASTTVTVTDSGSGVDASTPQYAWTTDTAVPVSGWTSFASGDTLTKSGADGDWYLHIQAQDMLGNTVNAVSNRFRLNTSTAELSGLSLSTGALSPAFDASMLNYSTSMANGVSSLTVTPSTTDASDTITVSAKGGAAQTVTSGAASGSIALNVGVNTITVAVAALNGTESSYTVTVTRAARSSQPDAAPAAPELITDSSGGVRLIVMSLIVNSSRSEKVTQPDGTVIEKVTLNDKTLNQALELLKDATNPILTIVVNDTERAVQTQLPAAWIASVAKSVPNAVIEVKLNGSSFQLMVNVLDLEGLAARLDVKLQDLKVNVIMKRVDGQVKNELEQIAASHGGKLVGSAVDYKNHEIKALLFDIGQAGRERGRLQDHGRGERPIGGSSRFRRDVYGPGHRTGRGYSE